MDNDWKLLMQLIECTEDEEDAGELAEQEYQAFEEMSPEELRIFFISQRANELELLRTHVHNYSLENMRKLILLNICFHDAEKALIIGEEALRQYPDEQDMLIYTVRAATSIDRSRGKEAFMKLTHDISRNNLSAEGYRAAIRYLIPTIQQDQSLVRELLCDYKLHHPDDQEWIFLCHEADAALKNDPNNHNDLTDKSRSNKET